MFPHQHTGETPLSTPLHLLKSLCQSPYLTVDAASLAIIIPNFLWILKLPYILQAINMPPCKYIKKRVKNLRAIPDHAVMTILLSLWLTSYPKPLPSIHTVLKSPGLILSNCPVLPWENKIPRRKRAGY
jgi:hypothetical protein